MGGSCQQNILFIVLRPLRQLNFAQDTECRPFTFFLKFKVTHLIDSIDLFKISIFFVLGEMAILTDFYSSLEDYRESERVTER